MRLSASDESFTHQISLPHAIVGSSDPSWRERYWLSMQDIAAKDLAMTLGFGQYPNQNVQEGFVSVAVGGRQHNLRLSRALSADPENLRIGPLSATVIRPYEDIHLVLEENDSGVSFDLHWLGRMEPILEHPHFQVTGSRVSHDIIRYVQLGRVEGRLRTPDGDRTATPDTWWTERDHSWGTRPLPRVPGGPPGARPEWRLLMFCPIQFEDFSLHIYLYEDEHGHPVHLSAAMSGPLNATEPQVFPAIVAIQHDFRWVAGARYLTLDRGALVARLADGGELRFELTALPGRAHLRGGGYEGWNGWFQGQWKGEASIEFETWDLTDEKNFYRYAKASSDHLIEVRHNGTVGYGIMEYMVLPGYHRYQEAIPARRGATSG